MKKFAFASLLTAAVMFAQATPPANPPASGDSTTTTKTKKHKKAKKDKMDKMDKKGDTTTTPPAK
jgi:hypothetical protein